MGKTSEGNSIGRPLRLNYSNDNHANALNLSSVCDGRITTNTQPSHANGLIGRKGK